MAASDVLKVLERGGEFTVNDIIELGGLEPEATKKAIARLIKDVSENIIVRPMTQEEKQEIYGRKLGCKIYIYKLE